MVAVAAIDSIGIPDPRDDGQFNSQTSSRCSEWIGDESVTGGDEVW